jgi:hypothetical protein
LLFIWTHWLHFWNWDPLTLKKIVTQLPDTCLLSGAPHICWQVMAEDSATELKEI